MTTAFDSDVLIYAASDGHVIGARVARLFDTDASDTVGTGSVLLLPETLVKPTRADPRSREAATLERMLGKLDLLPVDTAIARAAVGLAVTYGLRAADSVHLATAVASGADRFLTNNRKDFPKTIAEIDIVYPDDLPPAQR